MKAWQDHPVILRRQRSKPRQEDLALRQSEARLREAQRVAQIGSWELDLLENRLWWSDEIYRIFEIDPAHFDATFESFIAAIHPADRDSVSHAYENSLQTRSPYAIEHRLLFPGDRIKWVRERCETHYDPAGMALRSIGTVQDITARKLDELALQRNLQEKEELLRELHHRVKNNMQVVTSLLNIQARHLNADNALKIFNDSRERIRAMAMIHDRLYSFPDLAHIDMIPYLSYLAAHLPRIYHHCPADARIKVVGVSPPLTIKQALPCALIAHELMLNALRHGGGAGPTEIEVSLAAEPLGECRLVVRDHGPGLPEWRQGAAPGLPGVGTTLVRELVRQLHGRVDFSPAMPGARATLSFPLALTEKSRP